MKVQDLRVGNFYIGYDGNYDIVDCNLFKMVEDGIDLDEIIKSPIPLTEEILLKCGFCKGKDSSFLIDVGSKRTLQINNVEDNPHAWLKDDFSTINFEYVFISHPKYIHQLQNLYFALCSQELNTSELL